MFDFSTIDVFHLGARVHSESLLGSKGSVVGLG